MKTLCQLVSQYKSDVETRIGCIKEEFDVCDHDIDEYDEQIAHWQATLAKINEIIRHNSHIEFKLDNPELEGGD